MAIIEPTSLNNRNFNSFGSNTGGFQGFGQSQSNIEIDELLILAKMQGGRVGQIAEELSGTGKRSILSTIGKGFKDVFNGFIETISVSGQVVAGMISPDFTIKEAIEKNKRVTDVIFGDTNIFDSTGTPTTMQKIGDTIVRLPIDILTDPITYLTFGSHRAVGLLGKMGFGANSKVSLKVNAAFAAGKNIDEGEVISRALSDSGQELFTYGKQFETAIKTGRKEAGLLVKESKEQLLQKGIDKEILDMIEINTKSLLKETIDKPFNLDITKKVISNILERNPGLVQTFIDKGGIKFLGKTILEGQRIGALISVIPGMKYLDDITLPFRNAVSSKFDPALLKTESGYIRIPEEAVQMGKQLQELTEARTVDYLKHIDDVQRTFNLNKNELDILINSISNNTLPQGQRLTSAYYIMQDIKTSQTKMLNDAGIPVSIMDNWVGLIATPNDTRFFKGNSQFSKTVGATQQAKNIAAIPLLEPGTITKIPEVQQVLQSIKSLDINKNLKYKKLTDDILRARSLEDVRDLVGRERDALFKKLKKEGKLSTENILKNKDIIELDKAQSFVKELTTEGKLIGVKETAGLTIKNTDEEIKSIIGETDKTISKLNLNKKDIEKEISSLSDAITKAKLSKIQGQIEGAIGGLSGTNTKLIAQAIEDFVGADDLKRLRGFGEDDLIKLKEGRLKELSSETVEGVSNSIKGLKKETSTDIINKALTDYNVTRLDIDEVNIAVKKYLDDLLEQANKGTTGDVVKVVKELSEKEKNELAKIISETKASKAGLIAENLDKNSISKLVESLKDEFIKNPTGVRNMLDSLLGKENKIKEIISLIDETKIATQRKLGLLPEEMSYLIDNKGTVYKRVATTAEELKAHGIEGFDENLLTAWTVRGMQNIRQSLGNQFAEGMVRNFGRWADEAPESWVGMSSALVNDEAKAIARGFIRADGMEMKFHPAVAKSFDDMVSGLGGGDEATAAFLKGFDKLQSYYKSWLTTIFPMFHGRNAISNVLLNYLDVGIKSLDPKRHFMAIDLIKKDRTINKLQRLMLGSGDEAVKASQEFDELLSKKVFTDITGHEWSFGEIRSVVKNNNVAFNPNLTGAMDVDVVRNPKELAKHYAKTKKERLLDSVNLFNTDEFFATKTGRSIGRNIEEQSRLINFMTNLIDTGDIQLAATRTKQFLFDYQFGLSKFEKNVMRRLIPFYSFTRFNLELQAKTLMSAPGKIAAEIKGIQSLGSILGGEPMTKEERDLLPVWLRNSINLKRRTEDGSYEVISGFGTPIEQPFQALSGSGIMGSLSPLIKTPIESLTGFNFFQGKPTSEVIIAKDFRGAPTALKSFIGYIEYEGTTKDGKKYNQYISLRPERMQFLLSMPYSRLVPTISKITDEDISGELRALQGITGVRTFNFDEEVLQQQKDREMIQKVERVLKDAGIRGEFKRGYNRKNTKLLEN